MVKVRVLCQRLLVGVLRVYQAVLSPLKPDCCRFIPSCSEYARIAVLRHGCVRGLYLATWRVFRCHPFSQGGYDPVP